MSRSTTAGRLAQTGSFFAFFLHFLSFFFVQCFFLAFFLHFFSAAARWPVAAGAVGAGTGGASATGQLAAWVSECCGPPGSSVAVVRSEQVALPPAGTVMFQLRPW